MDKTVLFDIEEIKDASIKETLLEVYNSLKERGYNPINQIAGYLITGDPGYISNYQNARSKIANLDRTELIAVLIKDYLKIK
ncbi:MAG: IreB family regulatory phosphoprotein [Bacilli bacterium]|nr:IreB family regulatory phosphoprotein [Bacilli bacterium]